MKLLFDQNLSYRLVRLLAVEYPNSLHARDVGLATAPDPDLWDYAAVNGLTITSKDTDFEQRSLLFGHPPKVIWIRLGNCTTNAIVRLLRYRSAEVQKFHNDKDVSFLALS